MHVHLGGSWPLEFLEAVADDPSDFSKFQSFLDQLHQKGDDTDYHICFEAFALASKIVNTIQKVQDGTCSMCRNFAEEGLCYMELRTGLKNIMDTGYEAYLQAVMRGIEQGCEGTPLKVAILLSLKRNSSRELAQETLRLIKKYRGKVVGLDVSDDALLPDASNIAEIIEEIHAQGIPVALHLGECKEETEDQQIRELNTFLPSRIGHGVFLCENAKEFILNRRIPIEMCLSSSVYAHMISKVEEHPALQLIKNGYPVAICTDDPLIFRTSHTKESELAMRALNCDIDFIAQLHAQALKFKFTS